jgi:hypothetical protein
VAALQARSVDEVRGGLGGCRRSRQIDIAIYDFDARAGATAQIADALEAAMARGVGIRVAFNQGRDAEATHNAPMVCDPEAIDGLEVPTRGVHDQGALMHHKYAVRDAADVWTGSTNWTDDAFSREENVIVRVSSPDVALAYTRNFEQLWAKGRLESSGGEGSPVVLGRGVEVQPVFSPRGPSLAHLAAERIASADHRVRILSPVITSGAVLGTLAELAQQGIEPERPPYQVREGGSFICFVRDPDQYRVELIERPNH